MLHSFPILRASLCDHSHWVIYLSSGTERKKKCLSFEFRFPSFIQLQISLSNLHFINPDILFTRCIWSIFDLGKQFFFPLVKKTHNPTPKANPSSKQQPPPPLPPFLPDLWLFYCCPKFLGAMVSHWNYNLAISYFCELGFPPAGVLPSVMHHYLFLKREGLFYKNNKLSYTALEIVVPERGSYKKAMQYNRTEL